MFFYLLLTLEIKQVIVTLFQKFVKIIGASSLLSFLSWFSTSVCQAQASFYDLNTIQQISISFTQPNWDYQMDTSKIGQDGYVLASQVVINGISFDSVGIKYKGNSSYNVNQTKNSLHIQLDFIKSNQNYQGFADIKLSNGWSDPSSLREVLSFKLLRNYMAAPGSNFARVSINGSYFGFYSNTESINKEFCLKHFYSSGNTLVKCNPLVVGTYLPNLDYLGPDSSLYYNRYELKSDYAWKDLIHLCDSLKNNPNKIHKNLDIDRILWMLAFNNVTINLDSYSGAFAQNYYLYKDNNDRFNPVLWDLNMNFGGFPNTGVGAPLSLSQMQTMSPMLHLTNSSRPLIKQILGDSSYMKMYIAHMRTITAECFANNSYQTDVTNIRTLIDSSVQTDPNGLFPYSQFQLSLTTNINSGPFQIPGIYNLIPGRVSYLNATNEFLQVPPVIDSIQVNPLAPFLSDTVWITCYLTNANKVQLGYRNYTPSIFNKISMVDDGNHHDGTAGDGTFGIGIPAVSASIEYFVYAENYMAGIFSPERAEHEYYIIPINISPSNPGDVVLNEFVSINQTGITDLEGKHEDWIELVNKTNTPIGLVGLYLSDDPGNPTKWPFPSNEVIPANGFAGVWADEDSASFEMHCNFKLSGSGEFLILSNSAGFIYDSVSFGPQLPDVGMARCPDGTGAFSSTYQPTFLASNTCTNGLFDNSFQYPHVKVHPNPTHGIINLESVEPLEEIELINLLSNKIAFHKISNNHFTTIDLSSYERGFYILKLNHKTYHKVILF